MGNTNLPQAGAANLQNGRDTLSGANQLTDAQQREEQQRESQEQDGLQRDGELRDGQQHAGQQHDGQQHDGQQHDGQERDGQPHEDGQDANSEGIGPSPSRPKNAPPRVPGQDIDHPQTDREDQQSNEATKEALDEARQGLAPDDPYNPLNTTGAGDPPIPRSHVPSGHSPSDAT